MEIRGEFFQFSGAAVTRAIGDQNAESIAKCLDLTIERIDFIAPAAVQKNQRHAMTRFSIVDLDRNRSLDERRVRKRDEGQAVTCQGRFLASSRLFFS